MLMNNNIIEESPSLSSNCPSEGHLLRDLKFLFDSIIHPQTMVSYRPQKTRELALSAATKLLDCKQFVRDYYKVDKTAIINPFAIHLSCVVELVDHPKDYTAPPPEIIVLPLDATVGDLKVEATKAFQEVYVLFKRFQAEELLDYKSASDLTRINFLFGMSGSVRVRGRCCLEKHGLHRFRMERGTENWTVDCTCGTKDDDGERMLACDLCGVWQHTRCAGIDDSAAVPATYVCGRCEGTHRNGSPSITKAGRPCKDEINAKAGRQCKNETNAGIQCKDETMASANVGFENNLTMPFGVR